MTEPSREEINQAVLGERERCAKLAEDFSWTLPMYTNREANIASDDAAEMVKDQIAAAIRSGR